MRKFLGINLIIFMTIAGFVLTQPLRAQIHKVTVVVEGMACPFCAYGIEKKLKKVDGVRSMVIKIKEGMAILETEEEESIGLAHIPKAIRDAGFSPSTIEIEATGIVKKVDGQDLTFQVNRSPLSLRLADMENALKDHLLASAESGRMVRIVGTVREKAEGIFFFSPRTVKKESQ